MGCFGRRRSAAYQAQDWQGAGPWANWKSWACGSSDRPAASSGNRAFDEYKADTLRRMEEEQKDFGAFLERLRFAKDKAEFDQFMAERRAAAGSPANEQPAPDRRSTLMGSGPDALPGHFVQGVIAPGDWLRPRSGCINQYRLPTTDASGRRHRVVWRIFCIHLGAS